MKKLLIGLLAIGTLSAHAVILKIEPTKDSANISSTRYNGTGGSIEQKVTAFEDKERGFVCYITSGTIKGLVPGTANETNPAISCLKL